MRLKRSRVVLAVLSSAGGGPWSPAQLQKVFFALDHAEVAELGGPLWEFVMYHHGPFDSAVYEELEALRRDRFVQLGGGSLGRNRTYGLTAPGQAEGERELLRLRTPLQTYIRRLSEWVRGLSFRDLAAAGSEDFPSM